MAAVAVVADQRRVLEVARGGCRRSRRAGASPSLPRSSSGRRTSPNGSFTVSPSSVAGQKFIAGEPMKPATKRLTGLVVELARRVDLLQHARAHDGDAVAERHRLGLVVGDVDRRRRRGALQPRDLRAHLHAQLRVEVRQRLVHQERLRVAHDRAAHRDALALAAGEVRRLAVEVLRRGRGSSPRRSTFSVDLRLRRPSRASARSPCSRARSCAGTARSSGRPSRCRGPSGRAR